MSAGIENATVIDRRYRLFTDDCDGNFPPMRRATMLKKKYALPGSELHFSFDDRHCFTRSRQDHADMRWHIIAALRTVGEVICIFGHQTIEELFQIVSRGRIGIFHHNYATTGVPNKDCHCPVAGPTFLDLRLDIIGDFVGSFSVRAHVELFLMDTHGVSGHENNIAQSNSRALIFVPASDLMAS